MALHKRLKPGAELTLLSGEVIKNESSVSIKVSIRTPKAQNAQSTSIEDNQDESDQEIQ